jgi:hypothetical protein
VARLRQIDHVIALKYFSSPLTSYSPLMDASERNAAYRFGTKVRCDCGCKRIVPIRTRNRHRKRLQDASHNASDSRLADSGLTEAVNDVEMIIEPAESDSGAQEAQNLADSGVANVDSEPLGSIDDTNVTMDLDDENSGTQDAPETIPHTGYNYGDLEEVSQAPSSPRDWFDVGTPPPSPPQFPLPRSDEELSDLEDDYIEVTADDYREYDRWYAEDCEPELDEFCVSISLVYNRSTHLKLSKIC